MPTRHDDMPTVPHKILLIKLRHHGDMILTTPVINNLRQHYPEAEIVLYKETAPILANHPAIAQIHAIRSSMEKAGTAASVGTGIRVSANLARSPL